MKHCSWSRRKILLTHLDPMDGMPLSRRPSFLRVAMSSRHGTLHLDSFAPNICSIRDTSSVSLCLKAKPNVPVLQRTFSALPVDQRASTHLL